MDDVLIDNVVALMRKEGLSEAKLSRATGIPQPTLHKILSGKTADPRISTLKSIADYFEVSLDQFYSGDYSSKELVGSEGVSSIPVVTWENCVDPKLVRGMTLNTWDEWVPVDQEGGYNCYALISKPSMEPRFPKGTVLIIDPDLSPVDGDLVVVHYPGVGEATLRELSIDGPNSLLVPLNQNAQIDALSDNIKILGVVRQSRFSYSN